ncbi:filamentous hemagglutinin N-terminal domain-containing protein [Dolichospermum sp. ST_sed9]|nr:filamentous hemagglutinin N-terminal domain-containing protein [Dolichospermum sp. ST_sed9]
MQFTHILRWLLVTSLTSLSFAVFNSAKAQIIPDGTLGAESSVVTPNQTIKGIPSDRIDGGAIRGGNLFHSFQEFNIESGRGAYFTNPGGVNNILTRVTGSNVSHILGRLGVLGNANLFFINPNGIIFGQNASLDIRGSFTATTADEIRLGEEGLFSASNPQSSNLLTVQPGALFRNALRNQQATINNQGSLIVDEGKNITLFGANVINTGGLTAPGGTVQLTGAENLIVRGNIETGTLLLDTQNLTIGEDDKATIDKTTLEGLSGNTNLIFQATKDITINPLSDHSLNLANGSGKITFTADTDSDGIGNFQMDTADNIKTNGRSVEIKGVNLTVGNINTNSEFSGGNINLIGQGNISTQSLNSYSFSLDGNAANGGAISLTNQGDISTQSLDSSSFSIAGNGGEIKLNAYSDITTGWIYSEAFGTGNGGNIILNSSNGSIDTTAGGVTAQISDIYGGTGNGGSITFTAKNDIKTGVLNSGASSGNGSSIQLTSTNGNISTSTLYSDTQGGNAGEIKLNAYGDITTGFINSEASGAGNGGNINLISSNGSIDTRGENVTAQIRNNSNGIGNGGAITFTAKNDIKTGNYLDSSAELGNGASIQLISRNGNISTNNLSTDSKGGNAGEIKLNAYGDITTGFINLEASGAGNGGNITLIAENGNISTQAIHSYSSSRSGSAGNGGHISIAAQGDISIYNDIDSYSSSLLETDGNGGNISLISRKGNIFTPALLYTASDFGPSGDISLEAAKNIRVGRTISTSRNSSGGTIKLISGNSISIEGLVNSLTNICSQDNICNGNSPVGGNIYLKSPLITSNNKSVLVDIDGLGTGGNLIVETDILTLQGGDDAHLGTKTIGLGTGGNLIVNAKEVNLINGGGLQSITQGLGNGGDINLTTNKLLIQDNRDNRIFQTGITTASQPNIDSIISKFVTNLKSITNFELTNDDFKTGKGGNIIINASESIEIIGNRPGATSLEFNLEGAKSFLDLSAGITTGTLGTGQAGTLTINTKQLTTQDGAGIFTGSISPKFIPNIFPTSIPSAVNNQFNQLPALTQFLLSLGGITPDSIISNIYAQLSNFSDAGNGGSLELNADKIKLQGAGGLATLSTSSGNAGNVITKAKQISLQDGSVIAVSAFGTGNASNLNITTNELSINNGSKVLAGTTDKGFGGNINITASESVKVIGTSFDGKNSSSIFAGAENKSTENAGNITLDTPNLTIRDGARIEVQTKGSGTAGNIFINNANLINISGVNTFGINSGLLSSSESSNSGNGGTIMINQGNPQGILHLSDGGFLSVLTRSSNNGGEIGINVNNLSIQSGGQIISTAATGSNGKAGNINIIANDSINIAGQNTPQSQNNPINPNQGINSGLFALTEGTGNAGNISITTQNLNITDGVKISASTINSGKGGNINLNTNTFTATNGAQFLTTTSGNAQSGNINLIVKDNITLDGINTGLFANTEPGSTGKSGSITIDPQTFIIRNGAGIAVNSQGSGEGGDIFLQAGLLTLNNQAFISAETASNQGGNINLAINDLLLMRNNSRITATAGTDQAGGNGGNINIKTPFIVAVPQENSDITANAFAGNGGKINITTNALFGLEFRQQQTQRSDITASSQFGLAGDVQINTLDVDPTKGLVELPTNLVDPSQQIDNSCKPGSNQSQSSFVVTGRGGLPLSPTQPLQDTSTLVQWVKPRTIPPNSAKIENQPQATAVTTTSPVSPPAIVQASGWVVDAHGNIYLVAQSPQVTPRSPGQTSASCPVR